MRVKQPEPFDPNREYSPGERCVCRGMVLIAEIWTAADARLANNNPAIFTQRCVRCKIKREDCPGIGRQCDKFHRSDRKESLTGSLSRKGVSVPKEPGDKGCGNCANFTNEDVNGNGYCEAFKCEQSCGVMPCQEYKPKNQ